MGCCVTNECLCCLDQCCLHLLLLSMLLLTLTGLIIGIGFYGSTLSQFNTYNSKYGRMLEIIYHG